MYVFAYSLLEFSGNRNVKSIKKKKNVILAEIRKSKILVYSELKRFERFSTIFEYFLRVLCTHDVVVRNVKRYLQFMFK